MSRNTILVIPVHNNIDILPVIVESLKSYTSPDVDVLWIENGSSDGSWEYLIENCKPHYIIRTHPNLGVSRAWNEGIRFARLTGNDYKYIGFLNSDIELTPNWLYPMIEVLEEHPCAGMVGNRLCCSRMRDFIQNEGPDESNFPHYLMSSTKGFKPTAEARKVMWSQVACSLFKMSIFDEIGLFDENFLIYSSDFDIQIRMKLAGFELWFTPLSKVYHRTFHTCSQVKKNNPKIKHYMGKDGEFLHKKWGKDIFTLFKTQITHNPNLALDDIYPEGHGYSVEGLIS